MPNQKGQSGFQDDSGSFEQSGQSSDKNKQIQQEKLKDLKKSASGKERKGFARKLARDKAKKERAKNFADKAKNIAKSRNERQQQTPPPQELEGVTASTQEFDQTPRVNFVDEQEEHKWEEDGEMEASDDGDSEYLDEAEEAQVIKPKVDAKTLDKKAFEDRTLDKIAMKNQDSSKKGETPEDYKQSSEKEAGGAEQAGYESVGQIKTSENVETPKVEVIDVKDSDMGQVIPGNVEVESPGSAGAAFDQEGFEEDFWEILEQAGISKRKFFAIIAGFIGIILVILFFLFGGVGGCEGGEDDSDEEIVDEQVDEIDPNAEEHMGVVTSYMLGMEPLEGDDIKEVDLLPLGTLGTDVGVRTSFILGQQYDPVKQDLVYYVDILNKMENIYDTDVYRLLDISTDRRMAIEQHLSDMNDLVIEGERIYQEIEGKLALLESEYQIVREDQAFYEESFFTAVDTLEGEDTYDYLLLFIEAGQVSFEVKALFNAYADLSDMYVRALDFLIPRYDDILANKEALIKGIRVFDVPGSDIEAIIDVE